MCTYPFDVLLFVPKEGSVEQRSVSICKLESEQLYDERIVVLALSLMILCGEMQEKHH